VTARFVLDSSVSASWLFGDEADAWSDALLGELQASEALVPTVWVLESVNVLLVAERRSRLTRAEVAHAAHLLRSLPIVVEEPQDADMERVLSVGQQTGLSAYDAAYLDLAERAGLPLATRDAALRAAATRRGVTLA